MAQNLTTTLACVFAVLLMAQSAYSLKCFYCGTVEEAKLKGHSQKTLGAECSSSFADSDMMTCAAGEVCLKLDIELLGQATSSRLCGPASACNGLSDCYTCDTDGCNGASTMTVTALLITVPALLWKLY